MEHLNAGANESSVTAADETLEQLVARAKAEGNPWAQAVGIFPDDELTRAWIAEMRSARQRDEETADFR